MRLNQLKPRPGATKKRKRIGCGVGSGHGKTSTRGHKGAGQHSAPSKDARFEGGQMPFYRRIPKRGFRNFTRKDYEVVNVGDLAAAAEANKITPVLLSEKGLARGNRPVKILGGGELNQVLEVTAHAFSASARAKIEKAGGRAETLK
ncbi:MAG: 50S ribosomal protein L15 [candidate division WOR-3 bacterium]